MSHYRQSLILEAGHADAYAALVTPEGLRGWWTQDCDVATEAGGALHFRFGRSYKDMRIERLESGREVRWRCTGAHIAADRLARRDEWIGTQLVFLLAPEGENRTRLEFEHVGLAPEFECYGLCSNAWRHYLESLRQFVATGRGMPFEPEAAAAE